MDDRMAEASERRIAASLVGTITAALSQSRRRSAHPADQAALYKVAARVAAAIHAEFRLLPRHKMEPRRTDPSLTVAIDHE